MRCASVIGNSCVAQVVDGAAAEAAEVSGQELILLHLMKAVTGYLRCLPGLCCDTRFNGWQLLPQVRSWCEQIRML